VHRCSGSQGLVAKLGEGEGDSAEHTKVGVGQRGGREDWRWWSELDGRSLPSEERRG
jgi:hypothetical protein